MAIDILGTHHGLRTQRARRERPLPLTISTLVAWYGSRAIDFRNADGQPATDGQGVAVMRDRSGNGFDTIPQTEPTARPLLIGSALNGHPGLQFDGENDVLIGPRFEGRFTDGLTLFLVCSFPGGHPAGTLRPWGSRTTTPVVGSYEDATFNTSGTLASNTRQGAAAVGASWGTLPDEPTDFMLLSTTKSPGGTAVTHANTTQISSANIAAITWASIASAATETWGFGAHLLNGSPSGFCPLHLLEAIVYGRPLLTAERQTIEGYIFGKYDPDD